MEFLLESGIPPIFSIKILSRIQELKTRNPSLKEFKPGDFNTLSKWPGDQEMLAHTLNRALK